MKLPIFLLALIPIVLFLKFILLDILDNLVAMKKQHKKQVQIVPVTTETYDYRKAQ